MNVELAKLTFAARVFAVTWLSVWLFAQTLCVHHCASRVIARNERAGCCAKNYPDAKKAYPRVPETGGFPCSGLMTVKLEAKTDLVDFAALILAPFQQVFVHAVPEPIANSSPSDYVRARPRADFVFQPEVSLGAAYRSLAPPALA